MRNLKILLVAVIGISFFASCTPYEEGPAISFTSAEKKLVNDWIVSEAYVNGSAVAADTSIIYSYKADNSYTQTILGINITGTWTLNDDGDVLTTEYTVVGFTTTTVQTILRLTKDELWTEEINGNETLVNHLILKY